MIPVGAMGERAPATQPCATMSVIKNGEIFARSATAMAKGAIRAAVAIFPAPIDAMPAERPKKMIGIIPAFCREARRAVRTTWSSVPLFRARVKNSVTPTSVRKRSVGKPASTCSTCESAPPERGQVNSDHPGKGQGNKPWIHGAGATQDDHHDQGGQGDPGKLNHLMISLQQVTPARPAPQDPLARQQADQQGPDPGSVPDRPARDQCAIGQPQPGG